MSGSDGGAVTASPVSGDSSNTQHHKSQHPLVISSGHSGPHSDVSSMLTADNKSSDRSLLEDKTLSTSLYREDSFLKGY